MASVSIRGLDDRIRDRLRLRAAQHGRSMEAEMRAILAEAVDDADDSPHLLRALLDRFGNLDGVELDIPARTTAPRAPDLR